MKIDRLFMKICRIIFFAFLFLLLLPVYENIRNYFFQFRNEKVVSIISFPGNTDISNY